jgi:hypothetical protein
MSVVSSGWRSSGKKHEELAGCQVEHEQSARKVSSITFDHLKNRQRGRLLHTVFVHSGGRRIVEQPGV